jgi:hypothetical protein
MRRSSYLKLSYIAAFIVALGIYPMPGISAPLTNATGISLQTPVAMNEQLDTTLASYYQKPYGDGFKLEDMAHAKGLTPGQGLAKVKNLEEEVSHAGIWRGPQTVLPPRNLPQAWRAVMNSDLIVIGVPVQSRSLFIEDHSFLFTEYSVKVEKVLAPEHSNVLPGDMIIVSRPGGEMVIDNVPIGAIDPAYTEFLLNQRYVLMLEYIPGTSTYRAHASRTYAVRNGRVFSTSNLEKTTTPPKDLPIFLADIDTCLERKREVTEERKRSGRN